MTFPDKDLHAGLSGSKGLGADPANPNVVQLPSDKMPIVGAQDFLSALEDGKSSESLSNSPWAKMFPSGATEKQLKVFVQTFIKDLIAQMRHQDEIHKEHMNEMKEDL